MDEPIDLFRRVIPQQVIGLMPGSVARENLAIPIDETLFIALAESDNFDTIEKLRFVLNRNIVPRRATTAAIQFAIRQYYRG